MRTVLQHIQRATLILMAGALFANLVSFVKSLLIASYYGTSAELDAYFLSLAPLRMVLGVFVGALQVTLIPKYLEVKEKQGEEKAFALFGTCIAWVLILVTGAIIILFWQSSTFALYLGKGFDQHQIDFTASLLKISTAFLLFSLLSALGKCLFQAHRQFFFVGFVPCLNGICSLVYILYFRSQGVLSLLYGLIFGMFVQTVVTCYMGRRFLPNYVFLLPLTHPEVKKIGALMLPLLIGSSLVHVNVVVDQVMASMLPAGSISALQYATKLHGILMQMFVMVISQAVLPFFAKYAAENDPEMMKHTFFLTLKQTLSILLPLNLLIIVLGNPLVKLVFQRGAFTSHSTSATAAAWIAYTLGLSVQAIGMLTARVYNAIQDNKTLMYVALGGIFLNIFFNMIFMRIWGHVGIALSTSCVYLVTASIKFYLLRRRSIL